MLYSQAKERSHRFWLALRISIPFVFVLFFWIYVLAKIEQYEYIDISMFVLLSLIYVYFTFYMIHQSFKTILIDPTTKAFSKERILEIIKKSTRKKPKSIVLIGIRNLNYINQHYGIKNADEILRKFVLKLDDFLLSKNIVKTPIGKYYGGYFLLALDGKQNFLNHIFKEFKAMLLKNNIQNIEVDTIFSIIPSDYGSDLESTISILYYNTINQEVKINIFNYEKAVINAIESQNFSFKFHNIKGKNGDIKMLVTRLRINNFHMPKYKVLNIINEANYIVKYDLNMLDALFKNSHFGEVEKLIVEISPVSLRNNEFRLRLFELVKSHNIEPQKVIFEFWEESCYSEINRFKEIIAKYRNFGFNFALSHFIGKNYSFEYFKHLDIDFVIYDMEITKNLTNPKIYEIVQAIELLAKSCGVKTMLKFVDKKEIFDKAKELQIDFLQGFYIDKQESGEPL